jgi:hypothetical protein
MHWSSVLEFLRHDLENLSGHIADDRRRRAEGIREQLRGCVDRRDRVIDHAQRKRFREAHPHELGRAECERIGRPSRRPGDCFRYAPEIVPDNVEIFVRSSEREDAKIGSGSHLFIEGGPITATVDDRPARRVRPALIQNMRQLLRVPAVEDAVRPPLLPEFAHRIGQNINGRLVMKNGAEAGGMGHHRFANPSSRAGEEDNAAGNGPPSSRSSIISCADETRPVSRVRSAAASTYRIQTSWSGRRLIG